MDLACIENINAVRASPRDRTIFEDNRVLECMFNLEIPYKPKFDYFKSFMQPDLTPNMRKIIITWMMEICEEQLIEDQVLPLAVCLMDRFLCECTIKKEQFQLLASVCLIISSKLRSSNFINFYMLQVYTDYSVTQEMLEKWELLVLSKLDWNLNSVTAFDFVEQVLQRSPWACDDKIRKHAHILVALCSLQHQLLSILPSVIAAACLYCAIKGLRLPSFEKAVNDICCTLKLPQTDIQFFVDIIENNINNSARNIDLESNIPQYVQVKRTAAIKT